MRKPILAIIIVTVISGVALFTQSRYSSPSSVNITKEQVEQFLSKLPPEQIREIRDTPNGKDEFVKTLRRILAIGQEAQRRGIMDLPDVKSNLELAKMQVLVEIWRDTAKDSEKEVKKEEIEKFYKDHSNAFEDFLKKNPEVKKGPSPDSLKGPYAELCILRERAEKAGTSNKPEYHMAWLLKQAQVVQGKVLPELDKQVKITDADVQAYYKQHLADYDEVKASHILIATKPLGAPPPQPDPKDPNGKPKEPPKPPTKEEARKKAEDLIRQIQGGTDFAKLAAENSDDQGSKLKGGDLGYFRRKQMVPPFDAAAFSMKTGEVTRTPVETDFGFHIIKVTDHRASPIDKPLDDEIRAKLKQEKFENLLDALAAQDRVTVASNFQLPAVPNQPSAPAGLPAGHP